MPPGVQAPERAVGCLAFLRELPQVMPEQYAARRAPVRASALPATAGRSEGDAKRGKLAIEQSACGPVLADHAVCEHAPVGRTSMAWPLDSSSRLHANIGETWRVGCAAAKTIRALRARSRVTERDARTSRVPLHLRSRLFCRACARIRRPARLRCTASHDPIHIAVSGVAKMMPTTPSSEPSTTCAQ